MKNLFENERGIAFIMVLILLVLVGGLTAALMNSSAFNVVFGSREVDQTKSLYAADAGVEYMKSWVRNTDPMDILNNLTFDEDEDKILFKNNNGGWITINNDKQFQIELIDREEIMFVSTGKYDNNTTKIKFSFNDEDLTAEDIGIIINMIQGNYDLEDYTDFRGEPKDDDGKINRNNILLSDLPSWYEFLYKENFNRADSDDESKPDTIEGYQIYGKYNPEDGTPGDFEKEVLDNDSNPVPVLDEDGNHVNNKYYYERKYDSSKNNGHDYEVSSRQRYSGNDISMLSGTGELGGDGTKKMFLSSDEVIFDLEVIGGGNAEIKNSILVVDGSLKTQGGVTFKDSLVIVRDRVESAGGGIELDGSLIVTFDELSDPDSITFTGTPSIDYTSPDDYSFWPGIEEILESIGGLNFRFSSDWRQVR